jgi:S-adenosylmethionine:diacylglycerol 3-amino-3-carboxypropyl transferase
MDMLRSDIKVANRILDGYSEDYANDKRNVIYNIATEEIDHFMPKLDVEDKKVLTVAGSGDQLLTCALNGAKSVDAFDINPLQIYFTKLKVSALKALGVGEFNDYFYKKLMFSRSLYNKVRDYLANSTRTFFDSLYKNDLESKFYRLMANENMDDSFSIIPSYTKEENYYITRNNLEKMDIKYITSDLLKIHKKTKKEYEVIMLSNIYKWLYSNKYLTAKEKKDMFMKFVNTRLINLLSDDGIIQLYSSANGYKEKALEEECLKNDNMNYHTYLNNEMITLKKTRL